MGGRVHPEVAHKSFAKGDLRARHRIEVRMALYQADQPESRLLSSMRMRLW